MFYYWVKEDVKLDWAKAIDSSSDKYNDLFTILWASVTKVGFGFSLDYDLNAEIVLMKGITLFEGKSGSVKDNVYPVGGLPKTTTKDPLPRFKTVTPECLKVFREAALETHNRVRARHGARSMTLDDDANNNAQIWANHLSDVKRMEHGGPFKFGQNLGQYDYGDLTIDGCIGNYIY